MGWVLRVGWRGVRGVGQAGEARGGSGKDWQPACEVAQRLGWKGFDFPDAESIWNELRLLWNAGSGISYARLDEGGLQWPCPDESHPGTARLHTETCTLGDRAPFLPPEQQALYQLPDAHYPLVLVTGRTLYAYNAGTMTDRT